ALALTACGGGDSLESEGGGGGDQDTSHSADTLTIGGGDFTEATIMAELYSQLLRDAGYTTEVITVQSRELYAPELETRSCVLLVDEIDRADDEFEAFLLELLSEYTVTIPELGTLRAQSPPVVVLTSNRTREVHDALKRRCLYHWFDHPGFARELAIVRRRVPSASARLAEQVTALVQALRAQELVKPPGVAETVDWAEAMAALGATEADAELAVATLGSVLKYREDLERARGLDLTALLAVRGA
ncbi:glycine betaine ABC transporter substrate-binding protein, partial [Streptomyces sp. NPDC057621]|uniref:glycine betaine ABC transporter substrate-binding protein n=1 Tax=Streptomyces sp. NPDC057621 TaxID=3346186 RepID=UPI00368923D1